MNTETDHAQEQARAQLESIVEMVAALECDYERLQVLKDTGDACGTVSHGTMRPQDLLPAFLDALGEHSPAAYTQCMDIIPAHAAEDDSAAWWDEEAPAHVDAIMDALNDAAPEGAYFGAHPGDGADYGFWMTEEAQDEVEELLKEAGECKAADEARERIQEDALSVQVRSGWHAPGETGEPEEFEILLCTGGPAVRIIGDLDRGSPSRPRLQYQDWGTPWTELVSMESSERDALQTYCEVHYFGE